MIPTTEAPVEPVDGFDPFDDEQELEREMGLVPADGRTVKKVDGEPKPFGSPVEDAGDDVPAGAELTDKADGLLIDGDGQVSLDVGGDVPTLSTVALQGRKIELAGQFKKGELVELRVVARVGGVHFDDKTNSDGDVVDTTRKHILRIEEVSRA